MCLKNKSINIIEGTLQHKLIILTFFFFSVLVWRWGGLLLAFVMFRLANLSTFKLPSTSSYLYLNFNFSMGSSYPASYYLHSPCLWTQGLTFLYVQYFCVYITKYEIIPMVLTVFGDQHLMLHLACAARHVRMVLPSIQQQYFPWLRFNQLCLFLCDRTKAQHLPCERLM